MRVDLLRDAIAEHQIVGIGHVKPAAKFAGGHMAHKVKFEHLPAEGMKLGRQAGLDVTHVHGRGRSISCLAPCCSLLAGFERQCHLPSRPFCLEFGRNLTSCYRSFTTFRSDNYFNATPPCARFAKPGGGVPTGSSACRFRARRRTPVALGLGFPLHVKTLESMGDSRVTQFTEFHVI